MTRRVITTGRNSPALRPRAAALLAVLLALTGCATPVAGQAGAAQTPPLDPIPVARIGGVTRVIAPLGDRAWIGLGHRIAALDVRDQFAPRLRGQSPPLDGIVMDLAVDGQRALVVTGSPIVHVLDVRDPAAPVLLGTVDVGAPVEDVVMRGDRAWLRVLRNGRDQWGYPYFPPADVAILDLHDPSAANVETAGFLPADVHATDVALSGDTLAVAVSSDPTGDLAERDAALRLYDVSRPGPPQLMAELEGDAWMRLSTGSLRPWSTVSGAGDVGAPYVYGVGRSYAVLDLRDPSRPELAGSGPPLSLGGDWYLRQLGIAVSRNGDVYLLIANGFGGSIIGRPATGAGAGRPLSRVMTLPDDPAGGFAGLGTTFMVAGAGGRIPIVDPPSPDPRQTLGTYLGPGTVTDVALTSAAGSSLLLAASTNGGVSVLDRASPAAPTMLGHAASSAHRCGLTADGDLAVAGFCGEGDVAGATYDPLALDDPRQPRWGKRLDRFSHAHVLELKGRTLMASDSTGEGADLVFIDLRDIRAARELASVPIPGMLTGADRDGPLAVVAHYRTRLRSGSQAPTALTRVDVGDPEVPRVIDTVDVGAGEGSSYGHPLVHLRDERAYMLTSEGPTEEQRHMLRIVDVAPDAAARPRGVLELEGTPQGAASLGELLLIDLRCRPGDQGCGILVVDVGDPDAPRLLGHLPPRGADRHPGTGDGLAMAMDGTVYVADGAAGIRVHRPATPGNATPGTGTPTIVPPRTPTATVTGAASPTPTATATATSPAPPVRLWLPKAWR